MLENGRVVNTLAFERLRGKYSGALFIVASGPSVSEFPLLRYSQYSMMSMNGSICRFAEAGVRPLFYICDDSSFVRNRLPFLQQGIASAQNVAFSPRVIETLLAQVPDALVGRSVYCFERANRPVDGRKPMSDRQFSWAARKDADFECHFSLFRQKPNRIGFSRNIDKGYFSSRTIPYTGIQLAYHLGFQQVFVVGMDLDSSKGRFYEQGEDAVGSRLDGDYEDYILPCFELMAKRVVNPAFQVYNLSLESRLPGSVLPKLTLDQLDDLLAAL
ncbi:lipopolysaccharide core biosynthesis protein [Pseudomonas sp. SG20056]|uniref:lipopolysaccharide core biosynthesis protein n=1 Tax=Pseudomonas sp. SG20056 TaxID=3074146 RepID=UPI00287FCF7D|nr:lipopolysaccharide core biosynthesis protein [Pseudomonas sp. SG20056]WNF46342.1 lipopolysaccharide core biosynthesis protein [Pseudomonas sp. SG20056]